MIPVFPDPPMGWRGLVETKLMTSCYFLSSSKCTYLELVLSIEAVGVNLTLFTSV